MRKRKYVMYFLYLRHSIFFLTHFTKWMLTDISFSYKSPCFSITLMSVRVSFEFFIVFIVFFFMFLTESSIN